MNKPLSPGTRTLKAADRVAMMLVQHIIENDLGAGDQLPNEREMQDLLQVSRGTLREGLRLLEAQGAIVMRPGPGGGPVVREPRAEDLANSATLILQLMRLTFESVVDARERMEPIIVAAAAASCRPEDLEVLQRSVKELAEVVDCADLRQQHRLIEERETAYCRALGTATHNGVLEIAIVTMRSISELMEAQKPMPYAPEILMGIAQNRQRIVDAISKGDAEGAASYVRLYWQRYRSFFTTHYPNLLQQPISWRPAIER